MREVFAHLADYGHQDPYDCLANDDWTAHAMTSPHHGTVNVDERATLFADDDGYHTRQIAEYVSETLA